MSLAKFFQYKIIKIKNNVVIATFRQISLKNTLIMGTVRNYCFATTAIDITPFCFSTKICHKEASTINK